MATPLLTTKLYLPRVRADMLARPRLSARLADALRLGRRLTLISAPAGFGKTTLLTEWLSKLKLQHEQAKSSTASYQARDAQFSTLNTVAWLSLDAEDNDPAHFWGYLIAALESLRPGIGAHARVALAAPPPAPINAILTTLTNDWVAGAPEGQAFVLALDDYHVITTPAIHDGLVFLIDHLPPELQLVITSRVDPPLPLARWRARGELAELRATDLRFTPDEAGAFLTTVMHLPLEAAGVAALEARTEGWAAGLQLAALALRDRTDGGEFIRAFADSNRFAIEYLAEEVFARQPAHLQRFLLRTAILDRMCGPLCDQLLGIAGPETDSARSRLGASQQAYSQLLLRQLERLNLFVIPLDNQRHWYRYHHLFAEMLRGRLLAGCTADDLANLHRRASAWFEQNGLLPEAISQALAAQDDRRAADMIERSGEVMLKRGEHRTLQSWIDRLPADLVRARPWLCVVRAAIMLVAHQLEPAETCLADAQRALDTTDPPQRERLQSEVALHQAVIAHRRQEFARATALAREALQLIPAGDLLTRGRAMLILGNASYWDGQGAAASTAFAEASRLAIAAGDIHTALNATSNQGIMLSLGGQLHQAAATYRQGLDLASAHHAQQMPIACLLHANLADLLYEWNDLEALSPHLNQAIELGEQSMNPHLMLTNQLHLIRLYQARGDTRAALVALSRALGNPLLRSATASADLAVCQVRLWLAQGNIAPALAWAQSSGLSVDDDLSLSREPEYVALARVLIAVGEPGQAAKLLDRLLRAAESVGRVWIQIELIALQAIAHQSNGQHTLATGRLAHALRIAAPQGYVRSFVDAGAALMPLLREAHKSTTAPAYVDRLLTAFSSSDGDAEQHPPQRSQLKTQGGLVELPSERELEVLRLVAAGLSNQAIAAQLVVTLSTVKKHINHLYGKLGVRTRTQALARARALNLI